MLGMNEAIYLFDSTIYLDHHHNVWLISVPTGRFVADAKLALRFRTDKTFAADASLSRR